MSHEIRTPLNGIIGFTEILLKDKHTNNSQLEKLNAIKTSGDILLVIINDILDIAKVQSGEMKIESIPVNPHELVPIVLDTFSTKINDKKLNLKIVLDSSVPETILSDPTRISQILMNFVSNAIKFTPEKGDIIVEVKTEEAKKKSFLTIRITDTGVGVPEKKT
jgi:two-component system CheB/CheR fusion protein